MPVTKAYTRFIAWALGILHRRLRRPRIIRLEGVQVQLCPHVFNPRIGRTTGFFLRHMVIPSHTTVLELGTGTGAIAAAAAAHARQVVATDINPYAVQCAHTTMQLNGVAPRVEVLQGNLFAPVQGRQFDVILFNPPYLAFTASDLVAQAWCAGPHRNLIASFLAEARQYMNPGGSIQILFSSVASLPEVLALIRRYNFRIRIRARGWLFGFLERLYLLELS